MHNTASTHCLTLGKVLRSSLWNSKKRSKLWAWCPLSSTSSPPCSMPPQRCLALADLNANQKIGHWWHQADTHPSLLDLILTKGDSNIGNICYLIYARILPTRVLNNLFMPWWLLRGMISIVTTNVFSQDHAIVFSWGRIQNKVIFGRIMRKNDKNSILCLHKINDHSRNESLLVRTDHGNLASPPFHSANVLAVCFAKVFHLKTIFLSRTFSIHLYYGKHSCHTESCCTCPRPARSAQVHSLWLTSSKSPSLPRSHYIDATYEHLQLFLGYKCLHWWLAKGSGDSYLQTGKTALASIYRPISLKFKLCKVFERFISDSVATKLYRNWLLHKT